MEHRCDPAGMSPAPADSVVGSLCREVLQLRARGRCVQQQLVQCQQPCLRCRLASELNAIRLRLRDLQEMARMMHRRGLRQSLGLALLMELLNRPLGWAQPSEG